MLCSDKKENQKHQGRVGGTAMTAGEPACQIEKDTGKKQKLPDCPPAVAFFCLASLGFDLAAPLVERGFHGSTVCLYPSGARTRLISPRQPYRCNSTNCSAIYHNLEQKTSTRNGNLYSDTACKRKAQRTPSTHPTNPGKWHTLLDVQCPSQKAVAALVQNTVVSFQCTSGVYKGSICWLCSTTKAHRTLAPLDLDLDHRLQQSSTPAIGLVAQEAAKAGFLSKLSSHRGKACSGSKLLLSVQSPAGRSNLIHSLPSRLPTSL